MFENRCEVNEAMIADFHKAQEKKGRILYLTAIVVAVIVLIRTLIGFIAKHSITSLGMIKMVVNL